MTPIQFVVRDVFGRIVYNEAFPNLPIGAMHLSLFLYLWKGESSQVLVLRHDKSDFEKSVFKVREGEEGKFLQSITGEKILLPLPRDPEDLEGLEDDEDLGGDDDEEGAF